MPDHTLPTGNARNKRRRANALGTKRYIDDTSRLIANDRAHAKGVTVRMFKLSEIKELIQLLDQSSLQEIEIKSDDYKLLLKKPNPTESVIVTSPAPAVHAAPVPAVPPAPQAPVSGDAPAEAGGAAAAPGRQEDLVPIVSPMVGTFYKAPAPDAPPFVTVGSRVNEDTVVCIVEAMKLMNPIEAEVKGVIAEVLVENGQLVEYGQPLFLVKPD